MTFIQQKKRAAKELNLLDSSSAILTGRDITEDDLGDAINEAYLDVVNTIAIQYPFLYQVTSYTANYSRTSTVSTNITTALVITDAEFVSGDVGSSIYNYTTSEYSKITSYTNTTTVTLETEMGWTAGDVVYILEKEFTFGGDATDYISNIALKARYSTTGEYSQADMKLFKYNTSDYASERLPFYTLKQMVTDTSTIQGFQLFPLFTTPDTKAIYIEYLQLPSLLSADGDTSTLPLGLDDFLYWKAVEYGAVQRNDSNKIAYAQQEYEKGKTRLLNNFRPLKDYKTKRDVPSHYKDIKLRKI
jgi:hypothetical protein